MHSEHWEVCPLRHQSQHRHLASVLEGRSAGLPAIQVCSLSDQTSPITVFEMQIEAFIVVASTTLMHFFETDKPTEQNDCCVAIPLCKATLFW